MGSNHLARFQRQLRKLKREECSPHFGYIYVIQHANSNFYKIGKTVEILHRMSSLQSSNPYEINIRHIFFVRDNQLSEVEIYFHNLFKDKRLHGEWFELLPEDHLEFSLDLIQSKLPLVSFEHVVLKNDKKSINEHLTKNECIDIIIKNIDHGLSLAENQQKQKELDEQAKNNIAQEYLEKFITKIFSDQSKFRLDKDGIAFVPVKEITNFNINVNVLISMLNGKRVLKRVGKTQRCIQFSIEILAMYNIAMSDLLELSGK